MLPLNDVDAGPSCPPIVLGRAGPPSPDPTSSSSIPPSHTSFTLPSVVLTPNGSTSTGLRAARAEPGTAVSDIAPSDGTASDNPASDVPGESDAPSDRLRLDRVRAGDSSAFAELYVQHRPAALRAARGMIRDPELAYDLVAEGFTRVLHVLREDRGPREQLLPYLLGTMRNVSASWGRDSVRWMPVGATTDLEPYVRRTYEATSDDTVTDRYGQSLTSAAFAGLPERWRTAIWYLDVERERSAQVSARLGLSETALRQLARRAREGLREAYLSEYIGELTAPGPNVRGAGPHGLTGHGPGPTQACSAGEVSAGAGAAHVPAIRLAQVARGRIARTHSRRVSEHLARCPTCTRRLGEATDESASMRARPA